MAYVVGVLLLLVMAVALSKTFGRSRRSATTIPPPGSPAWSQTAESGTVSTASREALPIGRRVDVVGESHYQDNLERLAGGRSPDGVEIDCLATLEREPSNPFDPNAVRVLVRGLLVGYLSREDAADARAYLDGLRARGAVAECAAKIVGGWDRGRGDRGSFGVRLYSVIPGVNGKSPGEADAELVVKAIERLERASGPAARRAIIASTLPKLSQESTRNGLLLEASKVEVAAVLDKVDGLKTTSAKRRRLTEALAAIRSDSVADELQAQQIAWLEEALRALSSDK